MEIRKATDGDQQTVDDLVVGIYVAQEFVPVERADHLRTAEKRAAVCDVFVAIDDWNRRAPIALTRYEPIAQTIVAGRFTKAILFKLRIYCRNRIGSFFCVCNGGYSGNGITCNDVNGIPV